MPCVHVATDKTNVSFPTDSLCVVWHVTMDQHNRERQRRIFCDRSCLLFASLPVGIDATSDVRKIARNFARSKLSRKFSRWNFQRKFHGISIKYPQIWSHIVNYKNSYKWGTSKQKHLANKRLIFLLIVLLCKLGVLWVLSYNGKFLWKFQTPGCANFDHFTKIFHILSLKISSNISTGNVTRWSNEFTVTDKVRLLQIHYATRTPVWP